MSDDINRDGKFPLGDTVMTSGVAATFSHEEVIDCLARHMTGDWGEVGPEDAAENEFSLAHGFRLLSAYRVRGIRVWIITEADRSQTTVLLPEEY